MSQVCYKSLQTHYPAKWSGKVFPCSAGCFSFCATGQRCIFEKRKKRNTFKTHLRPKQTLYHVFM